MSIVTSQLLTRYFDQFGGTEVTFNKQVIDATGLITRNVYLKVLDQQWPCIIYSSSMASAKVIAGVKGAFFEALRKANSHVALRCCFKLPDKVEPISFFVPSHASAFTPYNPQNPDVQLITLEFTQRPPDDLILILGTLLEANCNSQQRKDERIILSAASMKSLGIDSRDALVTIGGATHKCIIRDLSFSGTKLLVAGDAAIFSQAQVSVRMFKGEQREEVNIPGTIVRVEEVEGRKDIHAIGICYDGAPPMSYKLLINQFLTAVRRNCPDPTAHHEASKAEHE